MFLHSKLQRSSVCLALALAAAGCERSDQEAGESRTPTKSIVQPGQPRETTETETFQRQLEPILKGEREFPADFEKRLGTLPPARLWSLLDWLEGTEAEKGRRNGLAAVVLSQLAKKEPLETSTYLTDERVAFGLLSSSAGLMAFRRSMTQWSSQDHRAAFEALKGYRETPAILEKIESLAQMDGERLEVTLAGAMALTDMAEVTARWDVLGRKEAASLLPRLLARLPPGDHREDLLEHTVLWLREQWMREDDPGVVFEWSLGLGDDPLWQQVLTRLEAQTRPAGTPAE